MIRSLCLVSVLLVGCSKQSGPTDQERHINAKGAVYAQNALSAKWLIKSDFLGDMTVRITVDEKLYDESLSTSGKHGVATALLRHFRVANNKDYSSIVFLNDSGKPLFTKNLGEKYVAKPGDDG